MVKILAIDDQQDNLIVLKTILYDLIPDVSVITAATGQEGIEAAESESPDVILLDVLMPGMDGFEVCRRLKSKENCLHIPIILITAIHKDIASRVKGLDLGADAFLSKPIDETQLVAQVKVMLRIKNAEDVLRRQRDELQEAVQETKNELQLSKARIQLLLDETDEGIWSWDVKSGEVLFNDNWIKILGYEPDERTFDMDWWQNCIHPDNRVAFENTLKAYQAGEEKYSELEYQICNKAGHWIWVWVRGVCIDYDDQGNPLKVLGTHREITEHKQAEEKIKASLKEKEILLQEIHHRVKNNMQVIASLLKLQSYYTDDDQIKEVLRDSQTRVFAMAAVHETLYGSENLSEISFKSYLYKISDGLFQTYFADSRRIKTNIVSDDIKLEIEIASPLGLIITELISNSLKYAFPGDRNGEITISLKKYETKFELIVKDNGVGLPDYLDWGKINSLGLNLIHSLVKEQLGGSIDFDNNNGTTFVIKFNLNT